MCYTAFTIIKEKTGREPLEVFEQAMNNIMPLLEVKARRVGGATYQVPIEIRTERRQTLGLRWLVNYSRASAARRTMRRTFGRRDHGCRQFHRQHLQKEGRYPQEWPKPTRHLRIIAGKLT